MCSICAIYFYEVRMNELSSRGSGVPPVKSTFALRRDAGATNDAQILHMSQSTFRKLLY